MREAADERLQVSALIESLHLDLGGRAVVEPIAWDKPGGGAPLLATMRPQEAIEAGLPRPSECDIVVVLLGYRIGTRLDPAWQTKPDGTPYRSGTEWESLDALRGSERTGSPDILVYRRNGAPSPSFSNMDEVQQQLDQETARLCAFDTSRKDSGSCALHSAPLSPYAAGIFHRRRYRQPACRMSS